MASEPYVATRSIDYLTNAKRKKGVASTVLNATATLQKAPGSSNGASIPRYLVCSPRRQWAYGVKSFELLRQKGELITLSDHASQLFRSNEVVKRSKISLNI